jgi:hypothetical protein
VSDKTDFSTAIKNFKKHPHIAGKLRRLKIVLPSTVKNTKKNERKIKIY